MVNRGLARRVARKTASICGDVCIIGCVIIVLPFWCVGKACIKCTKTIQHSARQGDRVYLASESTHPLPLPLRRRYNLSHEDIPLATQPKESHLMSLPYDVRKLIWEFAVGDSTIEILHTQGEQRLHFNAKHKMQSPYSRCRHSACSLWPCSECLPPDRADHEAHDWKGRRKSKKSSPTSAPLLCCTPAFALLKTCRQIYQECIPIVYAKNTFRFYHFANIPFWVQSVRKHHVSKVRRLFLKLHFVKPTAIKDWLSTCFCISTWLKSLEELEITLVLDRSFASVERALLEPLKEISGLKAFDLSVRYTGDVHETPEMRQYRKIISTLVMRPKGDPWESLFVQLLLHDWRRGRALPVND